MRNQEERDSTVPDPSTSKDTPFESQRFRVPALVVSGFLGAGKTTLVRTLLKDAQRTGHRLAVISNEFGELGIDQALLSNEGAGGYVELEGGCVCCQLSSELLSTLQGLWERVQPDRVIVETSGVALPFDTLLTFWREPIAQWVGESLAVVVVNAEQLLAGRDLAGTFEQQVSSADLLVLNKIDLVPTGSMSRLESVLQEMAPGTPVVSSVHTEIDSTVLFPPNPEEVPKRPTVKEKGQVSHNHEAFEAQELPIQDGIDPDLLIGQLKQLEALRVKGVVRTSKGLQLVQGVGPRIDLVSPPSHFPSQLIGRIVVIRRKKDSKLHPSSLS